MKSKIMLLFSILVLTSCDNQIVYSHYEPTPLSGWHKDSVYTYDFSVEDTVSSYQVIVNFRHTDFYPYQNMWLFVNNDTIEFYLADDRGKWLGKGRNGIINMPVLYEDSIRFTNRGVNTISVQHAMRDSLLRGVSDVGITIRKNG